MLVTFHSYRSFGGHRKGRKIHSIIYCKEQAGRKQSALLLNCQKKCTVEWFSIQFTFNLFLNSSKADLADSKGNKK